MTETAYDTSSSIKLSGTGDLFDITHMCYELVGGRIENLDQIIRDICV